jgi:hypothetical protein
MRGGLIFIRGMADVVDDDGDGYDGDGDGESQSE